MDTSSGVLDRVNPVGKTQPATPLDPEEETPETPEALEETPAKEDEDSPAELLLVVAGRELEGEALEDGMNDEPAEEEDRSALDDSARLLGSIRDDPLEGTAAEEDKAEVEEDPSPEEEDEEPDIAPEDPPPPVGSLGAHAVAADTAQQNKTPKETWRMKA